MRELDHVGVVVRDLDDAIARNLRQLEGELLVRRVLEDQRVEAAAIALARGGELELISPLDGVESGVSRFLERRGEGLHHVAYAVSDIVAELARLHQLGVRLIDETPRIGLHGVPVAFVHPAGMNGVLTELVERPQED